MAAALENLVDPVVAVVAVVAHILVAPVAAVRVGDGGVQPLPGLVLLEYIAGRSAECRISKERVGRASTDGDIEVGGREGQSRVLECWLHEPGTQRRETDNRAMDKGGRTTAIM